MKDQFGTDLSLAKGATPSKQKPRVPPHPLGFKCETCMFWGRDLRQEVVLMADGNAMPVMAAVQMGVPTVGIPRVMVAPCQLMPKWENVLGAAYCWQHKNAQPPGAGAAND